MTNEVIKGVYSRDGLQTTCTGEQNTTTTMTIITFTTSTNDNEKTNNNRNE